MLTNEKIENQLIRELEISISEYKSSDKFEQTKNVFNKLMSYNFSRYKRKLKKEVLKNIKRVWTNPKYGIDPDQKLDAILFEHSFPQVKNEEAELYGIIDWKEKNIENVKVDMGYSYDFADGLEQIRGIKISFFNKFVKHKLGKSYYENRILITEDKELAKCFQLKGVLAIRQAFTELYHEHAFDNINKNNEFHFLFGEHDEECYLILTI